MTEGDDKTKINRPLLYIAPNAAPGARELMRSVFGADAIELTDTEMFRLLEADKIGPPEQAEKLRAELMKLKQH